MILNKKKLIKLDKFDKWQMRKKKHNNYLKKLKDYIYKVRLEMNKLKK